ncbi:MAG: hypothetical protein NTY80_04260 [candidate division SR1 bacterium]|nr:hypothetical protein [candidate division SR1 bacterium]
MVVSPKPKEKSPVAPLPEKKPFVAIQKNPFINPNPSFNKPGFNGRSGGGKPAILKHSRSR